MRPNLGAGFLLATSLILPVRALAGNGFAFSGFDCVEVPSENEFILVTGVPFDGEVLPSFFVEGEVANGDGSVQIDYFTDAPDQVAVARNGTKVGQKEFTRIGLSAPSDGCEAVVKRCKAQASVSRKLVGKANLTCKLGKTFGCVDDETLDPDAIEEILAAFPKKGGRKDVRIDDKGNLRIRARKANCAVEAVPTPAVQ
jgi:hypothetical protein